MRLAWKGTDQTLIQSDNDDVRTRLIITSRLRSDGNAVDVGANDGAIVRFFVERAPNGHHFAFEPIPELAARIRVDYPTVEVVEAAVSNENGETSFTHVRSQNAFSGIKPIPLPTSSLALADRRPPEETSHDVVVITVPMVTLDAALPSGYKPDLIKIDVEGAEHLVIEGAMRTIRDHGPVVVFEHGQGGAPSYGSDPHIVYPLLCDAGLKLFSLDGNGPHDLEWMLEEYASGRSWNFMAAP